MLRARVTSKGQVTVPLDVRRKLDLQPGDELIFEINSQGELKVKIIKRKKLSELYGSLPTSRPYPGKEKIREETAISISNHLIGKGNDPI